MKRGQFPKCVTSLFVEHGHPRKTRLYHAGERNPEDIAPRRSLHTCLDPDGLLPSHRHARRQRAPVHKHCQSDPAERLLGFLELPVWQARQLAEPDLELKHRILLAVGRRLAPIDPHFRSTVPFVTAGFVARAIAGFGVKLFLVVQDLNQLRAIYRDRWESMIGNCGVMQFFAGNDAFTLKYLEERLGVTTVVQAITGAGAPTSEINWRTQTHHVCPLMTAFEIGRVFRRRDRTGAGRQLVLIAGQRPLIAEKSGFLSSLWTLPRVS